MKIKLDIDKKYKELEIHICNEERNADVHNTYQLIKDMFEITLKAYARGETFLLQGNEIIRIYAQKQKVWAVTEKGVYGLHARLYELEEQLGSRNFLRISNSEIVNIKKIKRLDTSLTGTIKMYLDGDEQAYVSRRYISKIKLALQM